MIPPDVAEPVALFVASESVVADVAEPVVLFVALVSVVSEPVLFVASVSVVAEPVLVAESVFDVAEPQVSVDIAVVFVVLVPVSVVAAEVDSSGRPKFFSFPNTCSFPNCSNSVEVVGEESVHSSTGARTNYDLCSILSNPGLHQNKNLEHCYNNPSPGYNNVSDTNDLPKNATTNRSRNRSLHQCQE